MCQLAGLSRGLALYNQSLPSKTRLVIPAETGPIFSDDHGLSKVPPLGGLSGDVVGVSKCLGELAVSDERLSRFQVQRGQRCLRRPSARTRWLAVGLRPSQPKTFAPALHPMGDPPKYDPNHLGLRCSALPEHQMALITSGCVPSRHAWRLRWGAWRQREVCDGRSHRGWSKQRAGWHRFFERLAPLDTPGHASDPHAVRHTNR